MCAAIGGVIGRRDKIDPRKFMSPEIKFVHVACFGASDPPFRKKKCLPFLTAATNCLLPPIHSAFQTCLLRCPLEQRLCSCIANFSDYAINSQVNRDGQSLSDGSQGFSLCAKQSSPNSPTKRVHKSLRARLGNGVRVLGRISVSDSADCALIELKYAAT